MMYDPISMFIGFGFLILSMGAGFMLRRRFQQYSESPLSMSGKEIAEKMLRDYGINDVQVISVEGTLTDHYNPVNKTVNLSSAVYNERNVAAAAVAAHECGHAVQHAQAYSWLTMRSRLVPAVNVAAGTMQWVLLAGFALTAWVGNPILLYIGVALFAMTTLFSFITLPVEFDASRRALAWLDRSGVAFGQQHEEAKSALWWAATTYVVAALASLAQLVYLLLRLFGNRD